MVEKELHREQLHNERWELLEHIDEVTEQPLIFLGFVWLVLLIIDFTQGLGSFLQTLSYTIWIVFIVDFMIEFIIAPKKTLYLRQSWLTVISLMLPALRVLRIFRAFRLLRLTRTARTIRLLRTFTSVNRGIRSVKQTLGRRGMGYLLAITLIVIFAGAAALSVFESDTTLATEAGTAPAAGLQFESYGEAVWWTAAMMTSLGVENLPETAEGRIIAWLLSVYALAVFGYITAAIATYFIGVDQASTRPSEDTRMLKDEIAALRKQLAILHTVSDESDPTTPAS